MMKMQKVGMVSRASNFEINYATHCLIKIFAMHL
ncbi:MAG: hypothetical protein FD134_2601 [Gallionellaceae bacterium]|nr:MAG: hypothetical protein FD134_2601 [Gallionellaceae bacterium]